MVSVDGIEFEIIRKRVKCARIHVRKDCSVVVSLPYRYTDKYAIKFVSENVNWIRKHQEKYASKIIRYEDGETISILGNPVILRITIGDICSCKMIDGIVNLVVDKNDVETKERTLRKLHSEIVMQHLDIFVPKWELLTGNKCTSYDVKFYKSRWGVCNVKNGKMHFNTELATKPVGCIDYVVLHEITHFDYIDHGIEFKKLMTERMPNWKYWEKRLMS